jgi:hypothetical protein
MICDVCETLQYPISATSPTGSSRRLICARTVPKINPTGFAALETSMSKQYKQLNLEIRFDAAELALLRKLVRQASLAAFEQKHLEEHKELEELLFRLLYDVHYLEEPGEKW